ncbi:CapA family protein [Nocardioides sp. SR21]|uniref:CapA family protein n=1 Tax=Nocardioides sp. SR21 TaxID=2919501 RepID=UPI001FAAF0ED|nr:CapA family protein [Nocardioides sp. SR21]
MKKLVALAAVLVLAATGCTEAPAIVGEAVAEPPTQIPAGEPDTPADPGSRTVSLVMGGDLLWHNTVWYSAAEDHQSTGIGDHYDWDSMFAALKPTIEDADLAICHNEVPFVGVGEHPESYPVFAAPRSIAPWIASMGWDACTTASNHSWDKGFDGVVTTADLLDRNGVAHVGTFRTPRERTKPVILTTDAGVKVGIVAGTYGLNGFVMPEDQEFAVSMWDADNLLAQARAAREAGADIVVVHVHWGSEYVHEPNAEQLALADRLTASPDVDVVLGEHAHVVQPITKVNGKWVVYGMGNQIAQNESTRVDTYEGITVDFTFTERPGGRFEVTRAAYVPTQWNHYSPGHPIRIRPASGERLASVREAVNLLGGNKGLVED